MTARRHLADLLAAVHRLERARAGLSGIVRGAPRHRLADAGAEWHAAQLHLIRTATRVRIVAAKERQGQ